jgi:hypothetical protein
MLIDQTMLEDIYSSMDQRRFLLIAIGSPLTLLSYNMPISTKGRFLPGLLPTGTGLFYWVFSLIHHTTMSDARKVAWTCASVRPKSLELERGHVSITPHLVLGTIR